MLPRHPAAIVFDNITPLGNTDQSIVSDMIIRCCKVGFVGGNDRNVFVVGHLQKLRFNVSLCCQAMALKLDIQAIGKYRMQCFETFLRKLVLSCSNHCVDRAVWTTR